MLSEVEWVEMGRSVSWHLPRNCGAQPAQDDLKRAAWELGITLSEARHAYQAFTTANTNKHFY